MNQRDGKELQRTQRTSHLTQTNVQFKNSNKPENTIQRYKNAQVTNFGIEFKPKLLKSDA